MGLNKFLFISFISIEILLIAAVSLAIDSKACFSSLKYFNSIGISQFDAHTGLISPF